MVGAGRKWDLLLVVANDRYGAERFDTVRRLIEATLRSGHSVQVWACGVANTLTATTAAPDESGDDCRQSGQRPAADLISELVAEYPDRFSWVACQSCSDECGCAEHIPGVLTEPGFANFGEFVDGAVKTVYIGGS